MKKWGWLILAVVLLSVAGCSSKSSNETKKKDTVNIGVTNSLATINPLLGGGNEVDKYAIGFEFLPLVELNEKLEFEEQLAESITTEDNLTFTVKIADKATWSDGEAITADDVIFTVLRMTSAEVGNINIFSFATFKGFDENGNSPSGATSIEGVVKVDDKTVQFISDSPLSIESFENTFGRYIFTVPKHILKDVAVEDLSTYDWFNAPTVVSGPYQLKEYDSENYITYTANANYWKGAPKIANLNLKIVTSAQLYAGLQSGELDFIQQTMGSIAQEDYANVEALSNIKTILDEPVTNQMFFINTEVVSDPRVRLAMLYAIDRESIVKDLLGGNGEVVDNFLSSYSPYYDKSIVTTKYDPEKAKALVKEAGWDTSKTLTFMVNSGDTTFVQAAEIIAASLKEVGINVQVETVNLSTLTSRAASHDYGVFAVQYTMAPVDPYIDIDWLINSDGDWPAYNNPDVDALLSQVRGAESTEATTELYKGVTEIVQKEVPFFSVYFLRTLGAVNTQLENAEPHTYGSFNNIEKWQWAE